MFCKKLCCDIAIRLVTINFKSCMPYSVTPSIAFTLTANSALKLSCCMLNLQHIMMINSTYALPE
jgi:hypothetical protein